MIRTIFAAALAVAVTAQARAADCDLASIEEALEAPLTALKPTEIEVAEQQSTEGGVWQIRREKDGRLNTVIRIDGGESGRSETRLSVVNRKTWGIAATRIDYNRHAFAENGGPFGIVKKTTDIYYFCDGVLYTPPADWSAVGENYESSARNAKDTIFKAKEIAEFVKGLVR